MQAIHQKQIKILRIVLVAFAIFFGTILCSSTFALDSSANFSVIVPEVNALEIALSDSNLVLNLTPQMAEASFGSKDLTITVGTSNIAGYNLMMNTSNTALTSAAEDTIESLDEDEDGYTCTDASCNFTLNRWGFKKSSETVYNYVPTSVELASNDAPTNGDPTTINFASRVDAQQPAGTYSTTLTFVATVNPTSMTINDIDTLQDFASLAAVDYADVIDSMEEEVNYTKKDARDDQDYTIAKLKDGKIWMTKNLNLAGSTALSASNTDVSSEYISSFSTSNNLTKSGDTLVLPASSADFGTNNYSYVNNSGSTTCSNNSPCYSYYSWDAATLGSGRSITADNTDAPYSICPKGWKLPNTYDGTPASEADALNYNFRALMIAYGGSYPIQTYNSSTDPLGATMHGKISASPAPNFLLTGRYFNSSFDYGGSNGHYWSSTSGSSTHARYLYFNSANVYSANIDGRRSGYAIRCVLDQTLAQQNVVYLQDFATMDAETKSNVLASMTMNKVYTLKDNRDEKSYNIAKLADGNIWFLDNLRLDPNVTTLTSVNTNVTATPSITFTNKISDWSDGSAAYMEAWYNLSSETATQSYGSGGNYIGGYYNYCAASAGTYCMNSGSGSGNASSDLCPAGWRIPTGGSGGEYAALTKAIAGTSGTLSDADRSNFMNTVHIAPSGGFWNASVQLQGKYGFFWSSTLNSTSNMYYLYLNESRVDPVTFISRYSGHSIRCILK